MTASKLKRVAGSADSHPGELESITVPLVISRISDGIVAYVNEPLAEIIRVPRDELMGQITPDFYHDPADRQAYLTALREQGQVANYDLRLKRGDGELFWALLSGRVIDFQGEPAIITSVIDINERREAQALVARRALELETVADVGTVAATILEPDELLQQVVELTKERFNLYHAHIYLLDEDKTALTLTNGAGEVGRTMVAEGRQIALSQEQSLVARAARTREGVIINDVQAESGFLPHRLLPDTRAEMAVPFIAGQQVLGVLDVQADRINRFTAEDVSIFTTLASQVAVALQNARRYDEAQRALDELTRLQRIMAREGWEAFLLAKERPLSGFAFDGKGVKPITKQWQQGDNRSQKQMAMRLRLIRKRPLPYQNHQCLSRLPCAASRLVNLGCVIPTAVPFQHANKPCCKPLPSRCLKRWNGPGYPNKPKLRWPEPKPFIKAVTGLFARKQLKMFSPPWLILLSSSILTGTAFCCLSSFRIVNNSHLLALPRLKEAMASHHKFRRRNFLNWNSCLWQNYFPATNLSDLAILTTTNGWMKIPKIHDFLENTGAGYLPARGQWALDWRRNGPIR